LIDARQIAYDIDNKILAIHPAHLTLSSQSEPPASGAAVETDPPFVAGVSPTQPEKRFITVMFCDLCDSTALSEKLDPEDLRDIIRRYQESCSHIVDQYEGYIAQFLGDGILVYFGFPHAHEDDAIRAALAALNIIEALHTLNLSIQQELGLRLSIRIGIHSGETVCGEMGGTHRKEQLAIGETPNIAARIQALAEPDQVLASSTTSHLLQNQVKTHFHATAQVKGISDPLLLYRLEKHEARSGHTFAHISDLSPMTGRHQEISILHSLWDQVAKGQGHTVVISGEPGTGKSRLIDHFFHTCHPRPKNILCFNCSQHHRHSAFHPISHALEIALGLNASAEAGINIQRARKSLTHLVSNPDQIIESLAPILENHLESPFFRTPNASPQRIRENILNGMCDYAEALATHHPLLLIIDDIQWADPSSLECIQKLSMKARKSPIMMVILCRPDFPIRKNIREQFTHIDLAPLTQNQSRELAEQVIHALASPVHPETLSQIIQRADGNPLFIEEIARFYSSSNTHSHETDGADFVPDRSDQNRIPPALRAAFMARLDGLGAAKQIAQIASCLGRTVPYALLKAMISNQTLLDNSLHTLVDNDILLTTQTDGNLFYHFKHALLRDSAHESILKKPKQIYHAEIARLLVRGQSGTVGDEIIARHFEEAKDYEGATGYYIRAGDVAAFRFNNLEAENHYRRALKLSLKRAEQCTLRSQEKRQLLDLYLKLGSVLITLDGFGSNRVKELFDEAERLSQTIEESPQLFSAIAGLEGYLLIRAHYEQGLEKSKLMLKSANTCDDINMRVHAHLGIATNLFWSGKLDESKTHFEKAIALYQDAPQQRVIETSRDLGVAALTHYAVLLSFMGLSETGLQSWQRAQQIASRLNHPFTTDYLICSAAHYFMINRNPEKTLEFAEQSITLSHKEGFRYWLYQATLFKGWALTQIGDTKLAIRSLIEGLESMKQIGAYIWRPEQYALLARAYFQEGQTRRALNMLNRAQACYDTTSKDYFEPELMRTKGDILQHSGYGETGEIRSLYQSSLALSRQQSNVLYELRALKSCLNMELLPIEKQHYCEALSRCIKQFNEGKALPDLVEANTLLSMHSTSKPSKVSCPTETPSHTLQLVEGVSIFQKKG
jgi:predicted ATPase/class 3 adenylate cyclase